MLNLAKKIVKYEMLTILDIFCIQITFNNPILLHEINYLSDLVQLQIATRYFRL